MFPSRLLALAVVGLLALFAGSGLAQPKKTVPKPPQLPPETAVMAEKRDRTHAIFDALTAGDANTLQREAAALVRLAELPIFLSAQKGQESRYTSEEYQFQVKAFQHAADDLLAAAKAKNLDAAALAYSDLTRTCVKCHTHFRGVKK